MKTLVIVYGADLSGKSLIVDTYKNRCNIVHTDHIYRIPTKRSFVRTKKDKSRERAIIQVLDKLALSDSQKLILINSMLDLSDFIILEGSKFFTPYVLSELAALKDVDVHLVSVGYSAKSCESKFSSLGISVSDLYAASALEYVVYTRFLNTYQKYKDILGDNCMFLDVTDESNWYKFTHVLNQLLTDRSPEVVHLDLVSLVEAANNSIDNGLLELEKAMIQAKTSSVVNFKESKRKTAASSFDPDSKKIEFPNYRVRKKS